MVPQTYYSPAILFLIPPFLFFIFKLLKPHTPPLPPGPSSGPVRSTLNQFLSPLDHVALAHLARSHGPLIHLRLGTQRLIVASSPSAALQILRSNDRVLSARAAPRAVPLTPLHSVWADTVTDRWRSFREICRTELFSARAVEAQAGLREVKAAEMVERLRRMRGAVIDVEQVVFATVVNVMSNVFFSEDLVKLGDELGFNRVKGIVRGIIGVISAPNLGDYYPVLGRLDLQGLRKKHRELSEKMKALWGRILKERRDSGEKRRDFLEKLFSRGYGDDQINQLLEDLFSAGIDTTTSTITRTLVELISNPESMSKLKQELHNTFNHHQDSLPSSLVENLPYLEPCVKETLRLHPPAPLMLSHRARETCQVLGYTVPKDARVKVNVWAIGRDPAVWEEPMEYRPERFLGSSKDFKGSDFELLPFGAGRRICPGMPLAAKIMPLIVASLVHFFEWSSVPETMVDELRATSRMREPLLLIPRARERNSKMKMVGSQYVSMHIYMQNHNSK